jgi:glycosyltransferase involved in cell wall biosynthesis
MRILHLIHSEGIYGAELILLYLAREQQQRGHQPIIGSMRDPGTPETPFEALAASWGLTVVPIRIAPRPTPAVIRTLLRISRSLQSEVLHSHGYKADILLGPVRHGARPPMVSTLHGWTASRRFSLLWLYERLDQWALGRVDAVVVVTRAMLKLPALRSAAAKKVHLIENGIPALETRMADLALRRAADVPRTLVELTRRRPTLVAIGRLSAEKGFANLIDAFARANPERGDTHQLLIIGEGPERDALAQRIAALGLQERVTLAGYVTGADRLLGTAAGFVMSSFTEGMPLVLMEALQWGVPILATAVGAIPELLQDGRAGGLVPPDDVEALARGLAAIMAGTAGDAAAARVSRLPSRFSSGRMAQDYLRLYEAIT